MCNTAYKLPAILEEPAAHSEVDVSGDPAPASVELREFSEQELQRELQGYEAEEVMRLLDSVRQTKRERHRGPLQEPRKAGAAGLLDRLLVRKEDFIWIRNETGYVVTVNVNRVRKFKEIVDWEVTVGGGASGQGQAAVGVKSSLEEGLVQEFAMPADEADQHCVYLGSGSGGAYVTAFLQSDPDTLFCKHVLVKGGWCVTIKNHPLHKVLTQARAGIPAGNVSNGRSLWARCRWFSRKQA